VCGDATETFRRITEQSGFAHCFVLCAVTVRFDLQIPAIAAVPLPPLGRGGYSSNVLCPIARGDAKVLEQVGHALKGALVNLSATIASGLAAELESRLSISCQRKNPVALPAQAARADTR